MAGANRLTLPAKLIYGSGTIAFGVKDQGFNALLMIFYNQVIGLPAAWVGIAVMIAMVVDAVIDPLLGQWSDDTRSRWGRRHPFMYAAAIPVAVSYFLLWWPPAWSAEAQFTYLVGAAVIVRISISLYEIPSTALLAEFSTDYDERTSLVAWRFLFGVVGGVAMGALAFGVFLQPNDVYPVGQLNPAGYTAYAFVAALVMMVSILVSSIGTQSRVAALESLPAVQRLGIAHSLRHMGSVLFHPTYLAIILFSLFAAMASGLTSTLSIYFATYVWQLGADQIALLTMTALAGIALAFIVALPLAARFGKKGAASTLYLLAIASGGAPLGLRLIGAFPSNADPVLLPILLVQVAISTACIFAGSILAVSMVADVTEQVQMSTGRRSEGLLFSVVTMVNKAVSGMGVLVSGLLLSAVAFPQKAVPGQVAQPVLDHLTLIYLVATTGLFLLAILCLSFYPITRAHHAEAIEALKGKSAAPHSPP